MPDNFEFYVDPLAHGRVTPRALLAPTGTIIFPFVREFLKEKHHLLLSRLAGAGWYFNIGFTGGKLVIQRNQGQLAIDEDWCHSRTLPETFLASWTYNELMLTFGDHNSHWEFPQIIETAPLLGPPVELVRWIRQQELSPVEAFENEEQFVMRVHSSLQRFEERFKPILNGDIFWDMTRSRKKIVTRKPKRETDVQSALHAMLVDHMQLSSIDIMAEARSPAGAVDFLLLAPVKKGSIAKMCVEFKNAHSPDLISGLSIQLRAYMAQLEVTDGAYCVLDYRGPNFGLPKSSTNNLLAKLHEQDKHHSRWPQKPIKIHWFELGTVGNNA